MGPVDPDEPVRANLVQADIELRRRRRGIDEHRHRANREQGEEERDCVRIHHVPEDDPILRPDAQPPAPALQLQRALVKLPVRSHRVAPGLRGKDERVTLRIATGAVLEPLEDAAPARRHGALRRGETAEMCHVRIDDMISRATGIFAPLDECERAGLHHRIARPADATDALCMTHCRPCVLACGTKATASGVEFRDGYRRPRSPGRAQ